MFIKNFVISITIAATIAEMCSTSVAAMTQQNNNNSTQAISTPSSCLFQAVNCQRVPSDVHRYIAELSETLPPKNLDLESPEHIKSIQAILKLKLEVKNKAFSTSFISGILGNIQSIKIPNNFVSNQKKFNGLLGFLSQLKNLTAIDLQMTDITDQQLARLLNTVNKNKITHLDLNYCELLQSPTFDGLLALTHLNLSDCADLQNPTFGNMPALIELNLTWCCQIHNLILNSLTALTNLRLILCCSLRQVTLSKAIQHLHIDQQQEHMLIRFVYV